MVRWSRLTGFVTAIGRMRVVPTTGVLLLVLSAFALVLGAPKPTASAESLCGGTWRRPDRGVPRSVTDGSAVSGAPASEVACVSSRTAGTLSEASARAVIRRRAAAVAVSAGSIVVAARDAARGASRTARPGHGHRSVALAAPHFYATVRRSLVSAHLAVTVLNVGRTSLAVSEPGFVVSARGDIFGPRFWNGGRGQAVIAPRHSRVLRLIFVLPRATTKHAALFYTLTRTGMRGPTLLRGSLKLMQRNSPTPRAHPPPKTVAPVARIKAFGVGGGVGEPWGIAIDRRGDIWFAEPGCDFAPTCAANTQPGQLGELDVASHTLEFHRLPNIAGNQPIFLAFDGSGKLWFTTPDNSMIGEFNPSASRFVGQWPVTAGSGPWDLVASGGKIWYTEHLGSAVGAFDPTTRTHRDFQTPTANTNPYGITASGSLIWFTENNSNVDRVAVLNTAANDAIEEYPIVLPRSGTPHLLTVDAHGNPWWTEGWTDTIATLNPLAARPGECGVTSGDCNGIQRFTVPAPTSCASSGTHTSGIAFQTSSGLVWLDNSLTAQVGSFNPSNDAFAMSSLSDCGAHPHDGLNVDGAGSVWFDDEFANALGELIP